MKLAILAFLLATLTACTTYQPTEPIGPPPEPPTNPAAPPTWVPRAGERIVTNYCEACDHNVGRPYVTTLTGVLIEERRLLVIAPEFPAGLSLDWVAKWE